MSQTMFQNDEMELQRQEERRAEEARQREIEAERLRVEAEQQREAERERQRVEAERERVAPLAPVDLPELEAEEIVAVRTRELKTDSKDQKYVQRGRTDQLSGLYQEMESSRKSKKEDSTGYQNVKQTLGQVNTAIAGIDFRAGLSAVQLRLGALSTNYTLLVNQAGDYLQNHKSPFTSVGKYRKFLVGQIQQFANEDQTALLNTRSYITTLTDEDRGRLTLATLFQESRAREIREDRDDIRGNSTGAMSEVLRVDVKNELGLPQERVFFKVGHSLHTEIDKNEESDRGMARNLKRHGAQQEGGFLNADKRNIATSVIAKLLNLDGLVVHSEFAKYVPASGVPQFGILMEEAKGASYDDVIDRKRWKVKQTPAARQYAEAITNPSQLAVLHRSLNNLQILDVICGQMDRHLNNFKVETGPGGQVLGVHGLDNDMAFGRARVGEYNREFIRHGAGSHCAMFYNEFGQVAMNGVDRALADRVIALSQNHALLDTALTGLITVSEIKALKARLRKMAFAMQQMIENDQTLEAHEWTPERAEQALQDYSLQDRSYYEESYFERFHRMMIRNQSIRKLGGRV